MRRPPRSVNAHAGGGMGAEPPSLEARASISLLGGVISAKNRALSGGPRVVPHRRRGHRMTSSPPLTDTFSALGERVPAPRAVGRRVDFLARRWAEYRYPDTIFAHLGGHALLQAGALLV